MLEEVARTMKCPVCGSNIRRESRYCDVCGSDLARRTKQGRAHAAERLPYDPHMEVDESSIQRSAVSELKETRAAYKEARRNAGKTNTPKVLAILLAVVIAAGAAAGVTWYVMDQGARSSQMDMQAKIDEANAEAKAASEEADALRVELKEAQDKIEAYEKAIAEEVVQNAAATQSDAASDTATSRDTSGNSSQERRSADSSASSTATGGDNKQQEQ